MRVWHELEIRDADRLPPSGPALVLWNHSSYVDGPALMAFDPYPDMTTLSARSVLRSPVVGRVLRAYDPIPVEGGGRDTAAVGALLAALRSGRVVAVAVEGGRSRTDGVGPVHPVLAAVAARAGVPLVPVGIRGAGAAMPRGALFPRRRKVAICVGEPFTLPRTIGAAAAAERIREAIAVLLPAEELLGSARPS